MINIGRDQWKELRQRLDRALELEGDARREFIDSIGIDDPTLCTQLRELIEQHDNLDPRSTVVAFDLAVPAIAESIRSEAALDEQRVGRSVGAYRLKRLLGAGGMGAVYLAERASGTFSHEVALKLVRTALGDAAAEERFERERRILARLRHPGIALLFDGGQTEEGQAFYTMEYVDGSPVTEYCERLQLSVAARVRILLQIAAALSHAHQNLVVHRDIKPSNVLVTKQGEVKLVDFGLARPIDGRIDPATTLAGIGPMTPAYAAPEQFRNGAITVATDIYQFGVLAFVILAGRLPYRADPEDTLAWPRAVTEQEPMTLAQAGALNAPATRPSKRRPRQLTRDLDAVVRMALAKEPAARYRSMDALMADLQAFLENRPVKARHAGPLYFAWRFIQRRKYVAAAAAAALIALSATALIALSQSQVARAEADRANAVASFLVSLFQVSDPGVNRGEKLTANQILDRGALRIDQEMAAQPAERARLQSVVGEVYMSLGDFPRARPAFEKAVELLRNITGVDSYDLGHALRLLAWVTHRQDDPSRALALLEESEEALRLSGDPRARNELVDVHNNRGSIKSSLGDTASALTEFESALKLADESHSGDLKIAGIRNNLGLLLRTFARNTEALDMLQQALNVYTRELGPDHPKTTGTAQNVALILIELNRLDEAQPLIDKALARNEELYGADSADYATALIMRGDLLRRRGNFAAATRDFERAREIYRTVLGGQNIFVAVAERYLGRTYLDEGNTELAADELSQSLALFRGRDPPDPNELALTLDLLAETRLAAGQNKEALSNAEEALQLFRTSFPPDHPGLVQNLLHLGLARYASGDRAGARAAWGEALDRANRAYAPGNPELAKLRRKIADPAGALRPAQSVKASGGPRAGAGLPLA